MNESDWNNFYLLRNFDACNKCQYFENEKCTNKDDCFWKIIERDLKDYNQIQEWMKKYEIKDLFGLLHYIHNGWWFDKKGEKVFEAFQIIKEKRVDVNAVLYYLKTEVTNDQVCHWYNLCIIDVNEEEERILEEEDVALLKEVLL